MIKISFKLTGGGWMEVNLTNEEKETTIEASYLSDAPYDLINAVTFLLNGINETKCEWQQEPGEYRWLLKKDNDLVHLQIVFLSETFSRQLNGEIIFVGVEDLLKFARQIARGFYSFASEYTEEGYKNNWGHEFPREALSRLRDAISKNKSEKAILDHEIV